jgi:hypothetical protein
MRIHIINAGSFGDRQSAEERLFGVSSLRSQDAVTPPGLIGQLCAAGNRMMKLQLVPANRAIPVPVIFDVPALGSVGVAEDMWREISDWSPRDLAEPISFDHPIRKRRAPQKS